MELTPSLSGIIGACLTPFDEEGRVVASSLERELEFLVGHCDGISILSVEASEYRVLADGERRHWLHHAVAAISSRLPVIAGASSSSPDEVIELAELAASAGASHIQVLMPRRPWGVEPSEGELMRFFDRVSTRTPLPIVLYHNPPFGADPSLATIGKLCELDEIVALKDSSRDITRIGRLATQVGLTGNAQYFTTMQPLLATLAEGGAGAMMPPPATLVGARIVAAFRAGDLAAAAEAQRSFAIFPGPWNSYGLPPVMKCAMGHLGIDVGRCAPPFGVLTAEESEQIAKALDEIGLTSFLEGE